MYNFTKIVDNYGDAMYLNISDVAMIFEDIEGSMVKISLRSGQEYAVPMSLESFIEQCDVLQRPMTDKITK